MRRARWLILVCGLMLGLCGCCSVEECEPFARDAYADPAPPLRYDIGTDEISSGLEALGRGL